jgi:hypothetical protein
MILIICELNAALYIMYKTYIYIHIYSHNIYIYIYIPLSYTHTHTHTHTHTACLDLPWDKILLKM